MNIVITGAGRGIGYETAKLMCMDNANRVVAISRSTSGPDKLKKELEQLNAGTNLFPVGYDLSTSRIREKLLPEILKHIKTVDVLLNNAAILINKDFQDLTEKDMSDTFNVNFFAPAELIRALMPFMGLKKRAHIVNVSSIGGFQGSKKFRGLSAYSSSKAALAILTECLAEELKETNISVNCLALGAVDTDMLKLAFPGYNKGLKTNEMARYIIDFCVNGHKYFNGKILPVSLL